MTDVRIAFRADPSEALHASREVEEALDGIQQKATETAQAMPSVVPTGLRQGINVMGEYRSATHKAYHSMGMLGVSTGKFSHAIRLVQGIMAAYTNSQAAAAVASDSLATANARVAVAGAAATAGKVKEITQSKAVELQTRLETLAKKELLIAETERAAANALARKDMDGSVRKAVEETQRMLKLAKQHVAVEKSKAAALTASTTATNAATVATHKLAAATKGLLASIGPVGWALIALGATYYGVTYAIRKNREETEKLTQAQADNAERQKTAIQQVRDSRNAYTRDMEDLEGQIDQLLLSPEEAATKQIESEYKRRNLAIQQAMRDEINAHQANATARKEAADAAVKLANEEIAAFATMTQQAGIRTKVLIDKEKELVDNRDELAAKATKITEEQLKREASLREQYQNQIIRSKELFDAQMLEGERQREQEAIGIYDNIFEAMQTFGMDEADLAERRLRALGQEESEIQKMISAYREFLGITKEQVEEEEKKVELMHRAQTMGVASLYSRIQTAAASDMPRGDLQEDKAGRAAEQQVEQQKRIIAILEQIERKPSGLN